MNFKFFFTLSILLLISQTVAQDIVINEFMSANMTTIADEDGDFSDWIEIYNRGEQRINLTGFALTDNKTNLKKWVFPHLYLNPQSFLLVYASGKNKEDLTINSVPYWDSVIQLGDQWKYLKEKSEPPVEWREPSFDDSLWDAGPSGIGYGDGDDSTVVTQRISLYMRKPFSISEVDSVKYMIFHMDYDDSFVAFINGTEIARSNLGSTGIIPSHNERADKEHEAKMYTGGNPEYFVVNNFDDYLLEGQNTFAIQVHNATTSSSDLSSIPFLTLGIEDKLLVSREIPDRLRAAFPKVHSGFKIKASGEEIILSDSLGNIIDAIDPVLLRVDHSFGRTENGGEIWGFFPDATPGASNETSIPFTDVIPEIKSNFSAGFYNSPIEVTLSNDDSSSVMYYTLDGGEPTENSNIYTKTIKIDSTSVLRSRSFSQGKMPSPIFTNTYIISEHFKLPVISISTSPENLWDYNSGIYVKGPGASNNYPYFGANYWKDWEKPAHIEFFETDESLSFSQDIGLKLWGGYSRVWPQKGFSIFARGRYGKQTFDHRIFPDREFHDYSSFILRNSGSEWALTMIRDAMMQRLIYDHTEVDISAWRPSIVFINGEYWGILNIREKQNEEYLAAHHGVNPDNVDMLEGSGASVIEGDSEHYDEMLSFLKNNSLRDSSVYLELKTKMDVDNFIDYQISEIYFANTDWPGGNIKYWRPRTEDGRWKWILYDTDFGFGYFYNAQAYDNTLEMATATNGPSWPNPPSSTYLFRKLLGNDSFKEEFNRRFADHLNITFEPDRVKFFIREMREKIRPDMPRNIERWKDEPADFDRTFGSIEQWLSNYEVLLDFAEDRPSYVRSHLSEKFDFSGTSQITLNVEPPEAGVIQINERLSVDKPNWIGVFFNKIPIILNGKPNNGYDFVGWKGDISESTSLIKVNPESDLTLVAEFKTGSNFSSKIVINEINYNSSESFDTGDWVEFHNTGNDSVNVGGWIFKDEDDNHTFEISNGTMIPGNDYLILVQNAEKFFSLFPETDNFFGNLDFGFSGSGEVLRLYNKTGDLVDMVEYDDKSPWPEEPDGNGRTLELIDPASDNSLGKNWRASLNQHGSPGKKNEKNASVEDQTVSLPTEYNLAQNFPNPFNDETQIFFSLPAEGKVYIHVYNLLGEVVDTIIYHHLNPGVHSFKWNPNYRISSGIYFYQLRVNGVIKDTRSMVLLR